MARDDGTFALVAALAVGLGVYYYYNGGFGFTSSGDDEEWDDDSPLPDDSGEWDDSTPLPSDTSTDDPYDSGMPAMDASNNPVTLSTDGENFIKGNEGLSLKAYPDASGYSIGYGHFIVPGDGLTKSSIITQAQADQFFAQDTATAIQAVSDKVIVAINQAQFDALVDFAYNVGAIGSKLKPGFGTSTLLRLLNQGDYQGAADQFAVWNIPASIIPRRTKEANLFLNGSY